jgi:hypothetical protein
VNTNPLAYNPFTAFVSPDQCYTYLSPDRLQVTKLTTTFIPQSIFPGGGVAYGGFNNLADAGITTQPDASGWLGYGSRLINGRSVSLEFSIPIDRLKRRARETNCPYLIMGWKFTAQSDSFLTFLPGTTIGGTASLAISKRRPRPADLEIVQIPSPFNVGSFTEYPSKISSNTAIYGEGVSKKLGWVDSRRNIGELTSPGAPDSNVFRNYHIILFEIEAQSQRLLRMLPLDDSGVDYDFNTYLPFPVTTINR